MLRFKKIVLQSIALVAIVLFSNFSSSAQDGKAIFQANCASCHNPLKDATGPALQGVDKRVPSKEWLYNWIHNSAKVISSGDKYANDLYNKWNKTAMTAFPQLSNAEIDAVIKYVNDYKAPSATPAAGAATQNAPEEDNSNMYILVTLALLVLMVILWKVNSGLKRVANEKQGLPNVKEIPFYRNKLFVAIAIILAFILAGYWIANGAIEMGRQQNYKPEQPIPPALV
jgi:mono/diheme cytochrome c family protein